MSGSQTQDARSDQSAEQRRKKRKERAAKNRAPEPKDIVSGAGQPLDVGVRRELEEQLGHDFSRVRLHTDRDAGALTDLLGADAVAVGQDIFFREGAFRPGTTDGQRLLAHELLHTVQNPEGLGALRAGRDLGAVSLPQQAAEREAEAGAQELVRSEESAPEKTPEIEAGQATPGWMRYATVDADRNRIEQIDPATLVDRLANQVVRSLRGDPEDLSKRTRMQLARMPEDLRDGVLVRLENRLLSPEHDRVLDLVDDIEYVDELEQSSLDVPGVESDSAADLHVERENERRQAEEEQGEEELPEVAPGPEKDRTEQEWVPGSTPENGGSREDGTTPQGKQPKRKPGAGAKGSNAQGGTGSSGAEADSGVPGAAARQDASSGQSEASGGKSEGGQGGQAGQQGGGEKKEAGGADGKDGKDGHGQQGAAAASKEESAAKNRPGAADALTAGKQVKPEDKGGKDKPTGSPMASGKDTELSGAVSRLDGVRSQDLDGEEEQADEDPFGAGSESEVEVGGGEPSAWDTKLRPEDFLPEQDLDVSGVPTADRSEPGSGDAALPSFPAPPPTKAEKVQAERDAEDAEDAADADLPEPELDADADGPGDSADADETGASGGELGAVDVERAAAAPAGAGAATKDPKSGDDPKAGPVAAQTTVQEAPGKTAGGETTEAPAKEAAAKEEKGAPAAGDKGGGAAEKGSQQAAGSKTAASEPGAKSSGSSGPASSTGAASGGASATAGTGPGAAGKTEAAPEPKAASGGGPGAGSSPQHEAPAAKAHTPAAAEPVKTPEAPAPVSAPEPASEPEQAPAPKAAGRKQGAEPKATRAGGGGGGSAAKAAPGRGKKDTAAAPNLATVSPEAGLSTASKLKPHKALQAMSGVGSATDRTVGDEHKALAAAPPQMQRPAGAPQTLEGKPKAGAPATYSQDPAQKSEAPKDEKAEVKGAKEPEGQIEAEKAEEPGGWDTFKMALGFGVGKLLSWVGFKVDAQELAAKFAGLPTKDEALKKAQAGNAPGVQMQGAAEDTAGEQGTSVDAKGEETVATGRDDAGRPMGENQVYPDAPKEQMKGQVPGAAGGKGGIPAGGASTGAVPPEAASEVAEHDRGPQFQRAFTDGQKGMSDSRQTKDKDSRESQAKHKVKVDAEIATNTKSQADERGKAMTEVTAHREDWRTEQDGELKKLGTKKTDRHEKVRKDVKDKEEKTDKDVTKEKDDGDKKIKDENTKAEKDAEKKRDNSVKDSGNWVSKAFNWLKEKVIEIKNAIVRVIKDARDAVVGFIKNFKETVERWINEARKFIVDTIKQLIDDLIEFAKAMVRAVIEIANRIRKLITSLIEAAIALVNRLAAMLKKAISDLLNAIAKLLSDILNILKKMLMDVIKAVVDAVKQVLDYASKLLNALGEFMLIAVDFLSDPGGWLSGAKNSAVDGAKNHLFREVVSAVKAWFQSKIEEIIGVPKAIIEKLIKGGFSLEKIVKETWDAVVPMLPLIIGEIVITKVIAKLIPGAGWAMAVIDAIRTAIGALGAILQAIGAVISWLKVVRQGGAGILFAKAVAAGVVVLLELAYQALMDGIGKYVAKVGKRLKGVAARLGKKFKPGKGDGKRPAGGADDKGAGKGDGKGAPNSEPASSSAPKPDTKSAQGKPGAEGSGKSAGPDGKKPTGKADEKGAPGKQDTSPTPAAKPKPKPEPPAKPKPEADAKAKPKPKEEAPSKPKDDAPGKPKDSKEGPGKPKEPEANKPKGDGKDAPGKPHQKGDKDGPGTKKPGKDKPEKDGHGKPKDDAPGKKPQHDKDEPGKKPKHDKDEPGGRKPKPDRKGPGKTKPKHEKSGPGRPKTKHDKDRKKKDEDSKESKDERLRKIVARIHPKLKRLLDKGLPAPVLNTTLAAMRVWNRLTSLAAAGEKDFSVVATLNPTAIAAKGEFEVFPHGVEDKVTLELRNRIKAEVTGTHTLEAIVEKVEAIGDSVLRGGQDNSGGGGQGNSRVAHSTGSSGGQGGGRTGRGKLEWNPEIGQLRKKDAWIERAPNSVVLKYDNPRNIKGEPEKTAIGQFRRRLREEDMTVVQTKGVQPAYRDAGGREYVKSESGSFVPREVERNLASRDKRPDRDGLSAEMPDLPATPAQVKDHVLGAQSERGGKKKKKQPVKRVTPFFSTSKLPVKDLRNPQGEALGGEFGSVRIDLAFVSPSQIFDLTNAADQERWGLAGLNKGERQGLQDVVRTQEILIHGSIPKGAILELRDPA
ncbi:DUF4157 domain-containing protein [Streptomyces antnestii]|uniref:DUF4157 domain-containing protein n=1 Tax=Streptomyces antnestii TaxID=2494256 RepID=A0A437Q1X2_9ACTN|nr:DUF4157 domain-containing protein [Streptomyces sp. San01]RVU28511.1 DUF4157 domain-containing protein [Streptomyces sp. San01]